MPVMDGLEATRLIRDYEKTFYPTQHLTMIALTAHAFEEEITKCLEAGLDAHMGKPIRVEALIDFLRQMIVKKQITNLTLAS